jgi:hypothetical protein
MPAKPIRTPNIAQAIDARPWAFGVNHNPQVIPAVQIPLAKWNVQANTPIK